MADQDPPDLLNLTQLRQIVGPTPQPYRVQVQIDARAEKQTTQGAPFLELKLTDAADSLVWRVFDNNPLFAEVRLLPRGSFIELTALWVDTGKYGIEPRQPHLRPLSEDEKQSLLAGDADLAARQQVDFQTLVDVVSGLQDPRLLCLASLFLEKHGDRLKRTAAARENHHARRGGLVEHIAQMMRCASALAEVYPHLNRDLLLAGVLFHDSGKLWENAYPENSFAMPYQLHGEMLGHITLGLELVNKLWRDMHERPEAASWAQLEPASEMVRLHLLHLIASHHGMLEYGSPVLPKTPEAIALHHVDNIDAKLEMFRRGYQTARELAPGIYERFRPFTVHAIAPLPTVISPESTSRSDETERPL